MLIEVQNFEFISKQPCQFFVFTFCHSSSNSVSIPKAAALRAPGRQRHLWFAHGWPKFKTRSLHGRLKLMILSPSSSQLTTKFPVHSALLVKQKRKTCSRQPRQKIFTPIKSKQTSTCLELRFCDFRFRGLPLQCSWSFCLKMVSNKFNSLSKKNLWY